MPEPVIDLGEGWDRHDEVRPPQWTLVRLRLIVVVIAVLALPAASLAGASPLPRSHFTLILRIEDVAGNTSLEPLGGVLVKQDRHGTVVFGPDGRERFRRKGNSVRLRLRVADGMLVVAGQGVDVEAFDLITGEFRWRRRGFVEAAPRLSGRQVARPIRLSPGDGWTKVAVLIPGGVRLLGALPHDLRDCDYEAYLLVCRTAGNFIEAWRVDF